jgi:hypothetical protein
MEFQVHYYHIIASNLFVYYFAVYELIYNYIIPIFLFCQTLNHIIFILYKTHQTHATTRFASGLTFSEVVDTAETIGSLLGIGAAE